MEIAKRTLAASQTEHAKAQKALELTQDDVEKGIDEAAAGLEASKADFVLAEQEFSRFTNLFKEEAVALRRSQEVTRSRDAAVAHRKAAEATLAKAESARLKIDVSKRDVEVSETANRKAKASVDLAETGYAQIHEVELLTAVKREAVKEAQRALKTAEDQLEITLIFACTVSSPVVVKRFRNLGDFASAGVSRSFLSTTPTSCMSPPTLRKETRLTGVKLPATLSISKSTRLQSRLWGASCGSTNPPVRNSPSCPATSYRVNLRKSCSACRCEFRSKRTTAGRCCGPGFRYAWQLRTARETRHGPTGRPGR